jgi:hypothetical protein
MGYCGFCQATWSGLTHVTKRLRKRVFFPRTGSLINGGFEQVSKIKSDYEKRRPEISRCRPPCRHILRRIIDWLRPGRDAGPYWFCHEGTRKRSRLLVTGIFARPFSSYAGSPTLESTRAPVAETSTACYSRLSCAHFFQDRTNTTVLVETIA